MKRIILLSLVLVLALGTAAVASPPPKTVAVDLWASETVEYSFTITDIPRPE